MADDRFRIWIWILIWTSTSDRPDTLTSTAPADSIRGTSGTGPAGRVETSYQLPLLPAERS
jgi:hypothetical protein